MHEACGLQVRQVLLVCSLQSGGGVQGEFRMMGRDALNGEQHNLEVFQDVLEHRLVLAIGGFGASCLDFDGEIGPSVF